MGGKIFDTRKYEPSVHIELCLTQFEAFCIESLHLWTDNIEHCQAVRRELWVRDHQLASDIARVGLDGQQAEAQHFKAAFQRYQSEKRRWLDNSNKVGMLDRVVKKQRRTALVNACQRA